MNQKQSTFKISDQLTILSPCSQNWNEMPGGSIVRNCSACQRDVYNFTAMTDSEIANIISAQQGHICARIYFPTDGEIHEVPQDLPTLRVALRRTTRWASAALAAALGAGGIGATPKTVPPTRPKTEIDHAGLTRIQSAVQQGFAIEVVDITDAAIAGATVTAINNATGAKVEGLTNQFGRLNISDLPAGEYSITVEKDPFKMLTLEHVKVPTSAILHERMDIPTIMGEVVTVKQSKTETQPTRVSGSLTDPPVDSNIQPPQARPNILHRFFSGIRNIF
jgi:hypothetical protein